MYRSGSSTRVSDEFFSPSSPPPSLVTGSDAAVVQQQLLPTYNPESHVAKKEMNRIRSSESAVHLIPILLIVCALILWFFSTPVDKANAGGYNAVGRIL